MDAAASFREVGPLPFSLSLGDILLEKNWEDVQCPICLDFPHNGVLLRCSSYEKGCRPFMCDTQVTHSNCLGRFRVANGMMDLVKVFEPLDRRSDENYHVVAPKTYDPPLCPLCRGEVLGWMVIDEARDLLNDKKRCCEEENCAYKGNYEELVDHMALCHPFSRPSEVDPARKLEWENFQRSSEIVDVLNTIHAEVPNGVVLGDYVIEYADDDTVVEYDDYHVREGNRRWASCFAHPIFRSRRSRNRGPRPQQRWRDASDLPEGIPSIYGSGVTGDESVGSENPSGNTRSWRSRRRQNSRIHDH